MRVLHLNSGNMYGGVETLLATLARLRSLCPAMTPEFALCFEGRSSAGTQGRGGRRPFARSGAGEPALDDLAGAARRSAARGASYDVVVCHGSWSHAIFAPVVRRRGLPVVFWAHGPFAKATGSIAGQAGPCPIWYWLTPALDQPVDGNVRRPPCKSCPIRLPTRRGPIATLSGERCEGNWERPTTRW